jgi:inward rectifier potassium channel
VPSTITPPLPHTRVTATPPVQDTDSPVPPKTLGPALTAAEREDLGFGRVVAQQARGRFLGRDGRPNSHKYGLGPQRLEHFYQKSLAAPWPVFLGWLLAALLLVNGIFALAYSALGPNVLRGQELLGLQDPFLRAFSFSVGVFTTTGTGPMYAVGTTAQWLVVFESLIGPFIMVGVAGLLIARLTRPRMRLRFSESAVIAPYRGGRGLMFRIVNLQPSELSDVQVRLSVALFEEVNGQRERRFHQLELERKSVEFFTLHWTVVHPITAMSPLRGMTPDDLHKAEAEFLILVNAHEETFSTRVTARSSYLWDEVRWDVKFADIFTSAADGVIAIDVERLDRTDRLDEGTTSRPAASELA